MYCPFVSFFVVDASAQTLSHVFVSLSLCHPVKPWRWYTKQPVCCQTGVRRHTVCQPNGHQATQEHLLVDGNLRDSLDLWDARMLFQEMNFQEAVVPASGQEVYLVLVLLDVLPDEKLTALVLLLPTQRCSGMFSSSTVTCAHGTPPEQPKPQAKKKSPTKRLPHESWRTPHNTVDGRAVVFVSLLPSKPRMKRRDPRRNLLMRKKWPPRLRTFSRTFGQLAKSDKPRRNSVSRLAVHLFQNPEIKNIIVFVSFFRRERLAISNFPRDQ